MYHENFKDTYAALNGEVRYFNENTVLETENAVIIKKLSPLCVGEKSEAIKAIRFRPLGKEERAKIEKIFGNVYEEKENAYLVEVTAEQVTVYSNCFRGFLYGASTIWTHYRNGIREGYIYNVPLMPLRAVKMYLPAEDKLDEFYYMLDMFMHYGYNALILEVGGAMEYKKHPEINAFWVESCAELSEYSCKARKLQQSQTWGKDSIHIENGGGKFLSQALVKEICDYARARGLEPIPEVPSLSHADYLIAGRAELAERPEDPYPDVYCPSNPRCYEILFDVMEEVISVFEPKVMHIGHDECYVCGVCPRCKGKKAAVLYAEDIKKVHSYLAERGIRTMMWSESLLNSYDEKWNPAGGARYTRRYTPSGDTFTFKGKKLEVQWGHTISHYDVPLLPEGTVYTTVEELYPAIGMIPKDIIAVNWYYFYYELGDMDFHYHGIPLVYGNFCGPLFKNWKGRTALGAKGLVVSSWGASDFRQMQRGDRLGDMVYASRMAWSREYSEADLDLEIQYAASSAFDYRFRDALKGSYVDILHTTDLAIKHEYFGCGEFPSDDMFRLGYFHVHYEDGSAEKVDILWGENVGPCKEENALLKLMSYTREPIFTCDFEDKNNLRYYRFVIPVKKPVLSVETEIFEQFKDKYTLDSIKICNQ